MRGAGVSECQHKWKPVIRSAVQLEKREYCVYCFKIVTMQ
jgi:hypothetical protein